MTSWIRRSWPVAVALMTATVIGACGGGVDETTARNEPTSSTSLVVPPPTTATPSTSTSVTTTTVPTAPPSVPASPNLRRGDSGPAVHELQQRLSQLGYWTGDADGVFGEDTHHAVVALQKAAGLGRDGIVGPVTQAAADEGVRPVARSQSGRVVEIDLQRQLLLVVTNGTVTEIFDTSTGRAAGTTPAGHWTVTREIDGLRRSPLGLLYRPKYFHEGVAVHGYTSVPPSPASHGCVRVTYPAIDHIWADQLIPIGTPVWVY